MRGGVDVDDALKKKKKKKTASVGKEVNNEAVGRMSTSHVSVSSSGCFLHDFSGSL